MNLEQLLKDSKKPIADSGFSERVILSIPAQENWLLRLDLSAIEMAVLALALLWIAPRVVSLGSTILQTTTTGMGALALLAAGFALMISEEIAA